MLDFSMMGKWMFLLGFMLMMIGAFIWASGKITFLGHLPGDFYISGKNYKIFFPFATCLLISAISSLIFWLISKFNK